MEERTLDAIRTYFKKLPKQEQSVPAVRVSQQVMDLQLIKYAIHDRGLHEEEMEHTIDVCIDGFIWLYENGVTSTSLPKIIDEDTAAKEYYDNFCSAWDSFQEYMRYNMSLMDR